MDFTRPERCQRQRTGREGPPFKVLRDLGQPPAQSLSSLCAALVRAADCVAVVGGIASGATASREDGMSEPESGTAGVLGWLRRWRRERRHRSAERVAVRRELKSARSSSGHRRNKPGAGGGYSGGS